VLKRDKTPVWSREDAKKLLESIPRDDLAGLRDRALISMMLFSFARVSAVLSLKRRDFYYQGPRRWLQFHEKGGKEHEMPAHHEIEETIDEYLSKVSIDEGQPLFQSVNKTGTALSGRALNRYNAWAAIRKRARNAGFLTPVGCHTWRATGVTVYLENGGRLEQLKLYLLEPDCGEFRSGSLESSILEIEYFLALLATSWRILALKRNSISSACNALCPFYPALAPVNIESANSTRGS
jgi:integrase